MIKNENNIKKVKEINQEWIKELEEDPQLKQLILVYEPFSEDYWKEKYKIVWYNLEPGGKIGNDNELILKSSSYRSLLEKNNQTMVNTSLFIYCLYNKLIRIEIDDNKRESARKNYNSLMECMSKVTYMNLIKDMNGSSKFDRNYFWRFFNTDIYPNNRERTIRINDALNPDILIVTGEGKDLFEQLYKKKYDEKHSFVHNNTLFVCLGHPGRGWSKNYIPYNVNMINDNLIRYNLTK